MLNRAKTHQEIAEILGITHQRVSQIEASALKKIKRVLLDELDGKKKEERKDKRKK